MPLFQQVGGSLTAAAALTLLAWGARLLRNKYSGGLRPRVNGGQARPQGRFFCKLSPAALRMLVPPRCPGSGAHSPCTAGSPDSSASPAGGD